MRKEPCPIKLVIPHKIVLCLLNQSITTQDGPLDYLGNFMVYTFEFSEYTGLGTMPCGLCDWNVLKRLQ